MCIIDIHQFSSTLKALPILQKSGSNEHLNVNFLKNIYVVGKKMARKGRQTAVYQLQIWASPSNKSEIVLKFDSA